MPALVGATEVAKLVPTAGFVDDGIGADEQRIAWVAADAASRAELHVLTLATKQEVVVDISPITQHATAVELVGSRAFVVGVGDDNQQVGGLVELAAAGKKPAGTIDYKLGPATHITLVMRDGKPRIAVHRATAEQQPNADTTKSAIAMTRHEIELIALETGKRIAVAPPLELRDSDKLDAKLELRVNHWSDGMTRAYGLKGGEWNKKEDQRSPDTEAVLDVLTGKLLDRHAIADVVEQRKRYQVLADVGDRIDFVRMVWDNSAIQLWHDGKLKPVELDQPIASYDPKSLQGVVERDGSAWIALKIDPVNPDAVARKKADPEYLDIFRITADGKATRKARVLATKVRYRFGVVGKDVWLLERSPSSERGGKSLAVYSLD